MINGISIMGRAASIARRFRFDRADIGLGPLYIMTEAEMRAYSRVLAMEQKIICGQKALDYIPTLEGELAKDLIEASENPEII